jgi:hypothetical protein
MAEDKNLTNNLKAFPELLTMSQDQLALLLSLLVKKRQDVAVVKRIFERTAEKRISLEAINQVRIQYADLIRERIEKRANDLSRLPLGNARKQLIELKKIYDYAMDDQIVRGQRKIDSQNYEDYTDIDARLAKEVLLAANKITGDVEGRRLEILKEKNKLIAAAEKDKLPTTAPASTENQVSTPVQEDDDDVYSAG